MGSAAANAPASFGSGTSLTLSGMNFGIWDPSPTASLAAVCSSTAWTSLTTIMCASQLGGSTTISVTISQVVGTRGGLFTLSMDGKAAV
jgi:hypothetical protein